MRWRVYNMKTGEHVGDYTNFKEAVARVGLQNVYPAPLKGSRMSRESMDKMLEQVSEAVYEHLRELSFLIDDTVLRITRKAAVDRLADMFDWDHATRDYVVKDTRGWEV